LAGRNLSTFVNDSKETNKYLNDTSLGAMELRVIMTNHSVRKRLSCLEEMAQSILSHFLDLLGRPILPVVSYKLCLSIRIRLRNEVKNPVDAAMDPNSKLR
jgi:hypothetical protein